MPTVAIPMAMAGTIQGTAEKLVQPNMKRPIGMQALSMHAKYRRPSGVSTSLPFRFAILSW